MMGSGSVHRRLKAGLRISGLRVEGVENLWVDNVFSLPLHIGTGKEHCYIMHVGGVQEGHIKLAMGEDRLVEIITNILQGLALELVDGHGKGKSDGELQTGQSEVKALTGGEPAAIDQVMLSIKVTTIDAHFQTAVGCTDHSQASAVAKALVRIEILEQYQRSANTKVQSHAEQVDSIQTV